MNKILILILLGITSTTTIATGKTVIVQEVIDIRATGSHQKVLRLTLALDAQLTRNSIGFLPPKIAKAKSDLREDLIRQTPSNASPIFQSISNIIPEKPFSFTVRLKNPARSATKLMIDGEVALLVPNENNSGRIGVKDFLASSGKKLSNPELAKRNISIAYYTKDDLYRLEKKAEKAKKIAKEQSKDEQIELENAVGKAFADIASQGYNPFVDLGDLTFLITDESDQILKMELFDAEHNIIEVNGRASTTDKTNGLHGMSFKRMLPSNGYLVIYLKTIDNVKTVPFNLVVDLP